MTEQELDAIEVVSGMIGGVLMEMEDPSGVGGVKSDLLNLVYLRLASLQRLCNDTIGERT